MKLPEEIRAALTEALVPHFLGPEQHALVRGASVVLEGAEEYTDDTVEGLQAQIDNLHSEYGAGLVGIEDVGNHFTAITVEGALQELAANTGNFDPDANYSITGSWTFTGDTLSVLSDTGFFGGRLVIGGPLLDGITGGVRLNNRVTDSSIYNIGLPLKDGDMALLSDIPTLSAGDGIALTGTFPSLTIENTIPQVNLTAGSNVNITGTYPNLTISATGGSGGGDVTSVNGQVGDVTLTYSDVGAAAASHSHSNATTSAAGFMSAADKSKLNGIASGATNNNGTVTSVNVSGGTGIGSSGGPITGSGTISLSLSTNLQSWSSISPSSKANDNVVVKTSGNQSISGTKTFTGNVVVDGSPVRRTLHTVRNSSGNLSSSHLNSVVEKSNNSSYTYTLTSSLGSAGDIITFINAGTGGNMTISTASGTSLWQNGSSGNITVSPGSMLSIVKTNASGRWQA